MGLIVELPLDFPVFSFNPHFYSSGNHRREWFGRSWIDIIKLDISVPMDFRIRMGILRKALQLLHRSPPLRRCMAVILIGMWFVITPFLASQVAASPPDGAMIYIKGSVWLNGSGIPGSSALLPGDKVQTNGDSFANIRGTGLNLMVAPDTLVNFQSGGMELKRGFIVIDAGSTFTVNAGFATIVPIGNKWTHFEVRRTEDEVRILAGDAQLNVTGSAGTIVMEPAEETVYAINRDKVGPFASQDGGILNNAPWAKLGGSAAAGTIIIWSLIHGDDPVSPWKPKP